MSDPEVVMMKRIGELKAEVERLKADLEKSDGVVFTQAVENERLKAEVERLRKAGDELLHEWSSGDETDGRNFKKGLVLWNAAKESKQS